MKQSFKGEHLRRVVGHSQHRSVTLGSRAGEGLAGVRASKGRYALYNLEQSGQPILRRIIDVDESEDSQPANDEPDYSDTLSELRKHSEHGLGHLLNPSDPESESRDWIVQLWEHIIRTDALGHHAPEPDWFDRAALTRGTITSPRLETPFDDYNRKRPPAERIRPFNFLLVAHVAPFGHPPGANPERFLLVAPYESDPRKWRRLKWRNAYDSAAAPYTIKTARHGEELAMRSDDHVIVKSYSNVLDDYRTHPEAKSLGPKGRPCDRQTVGLLTRRPVKAAAIHYIGKESNKIEEAMSGILTDLDDALTEYRDPDHDPLWRLARDVIHSLPVKQTAAGTGLSERTVKRARAGQHVRREARAKLIEYAAKHARAKLRAKGRRPPIDREALLAASLATDESPVPSHSPCRR